MTDAVGVTSNLNGLTDHLDGNHVREPGQDADVIVAPAEWSAFQPVDVFDEDMAGVAGDGTPVTFPEESSEGVLGLSVGEDWFDKIHIIPRRIDFGNILTTDTQVVDIFNAYRDSNRILQAWVNNVGDGLTIPDMPVLPYTIGALNGLAVTVTVTTDGVPSFNSTLDFDFDATTIELPVTGTRVIAFPYAPELPMQERLQFLTDVMEKMDGSEQRVALRLNPRQVFEMHVMREENQERSRLEFLMYDWQSRLFGVPLWHEPTVLTVGASISDTILQVDSTAYADYRVDGLAIVMSSETVYDTVKLDAIGADTLSFGTGLANAYPAGTLVYPVRVMMADTTYGGAKYPVGMSEYTIRFRVTDNDSSLADTSAFNTFSGKVLLDGANFISTGQQEETMQRRIIELDNETGALSHVSNWTRGKRETFKAFKTSSRQELWEVRQLLHALRGQQVSFWLPTFFKEFNVVQTLANGGTGMRVTNVGYTTFVQSRSPRNVIRVGLVDGTTLTRTIIGSTIIDSDVEELTVDSGWPSEIDPEDISRIDFFEKVRLNADEVVIRHLSALGDAEVQFPVKVVFD